MVVHDGSEAGPARVSVDELILRVVGHRQPKERKKPWWCWPLADPEVGVVEVVEVVDELELKRRRRP